MPIVYPSKGERTYGFKYVEDSIRGKIVGWMNEIIKKNNLSFDYVDEQVEIRYADGTTRRFPDITIWEKRLERAACLIELKPPEGWTPYEPTLINDTQFKVTNASPQIPYFGTWNVNELVLWKTFDPEAASLIDRRKGRYEVVKIRSLREIDKPEVEKKIREFLEKFLKDLEDIYYERKEISKILVDEFFIYNLRAVVDAFTFPITEHVKQKYGENKDFGDKVNEWFVEQCWTLPSSEDDFERIARQFLYLLVDKILFYNTLLIKYKKLKPITLEECKDGVKLKNELQKYFNEAYKVTGDYETIFGVNFIETIPIPDEIAENFTFFINGFSKYDFSKLGFKDISRIYDRLIPINERHKLGQYFTRPDIVDLINGFCIRHEDQLIADFGSGAGTFLIRGYARVNNLNPGKEHAKILEQLYGVDISKFPAHLSTISLANKDLSEEKNYPLVICKDFFDVFPTEDKEKLRKWLDVKERIATLSGEEKEIYVPFMGAVVGNPPYTRQEELEDLLAGYKQKLQDVVNQDWKKEVKLGKRAGIYAYFFMHGIKFLVDKGRFGYITSNSWLDVDYGKYLQEFFLKKTKIVAIIESKVERWFEEAGVNTAIIILERNYSTDKRKERKCKREREGNLVKFVQLKVKLEELIPPTDDEEERWNAVDALVKLIEGTNELYEDERLRVFPKKQKELWAEGFDDVKGEYVGSKWGKYIRAPDIFFEILEKEKDLFVPLKEVADVKRGFTTGANEFFYLTEEGIKTWGIEKEFWMHPLRKEEEVPISEHIWNDKDGDYFRRSQYADDFSLNEVLREDEFVYWVPNYVIKSPRECKSIAVNPQDLKYRVLMIHKEKEELKGTNMLKYIKWGEEYIGPDSRKKYPFPERSTCKSRKRWYDLGKRKINNGFWIYVINDRYIVFKNKGTYCDCELFDLYTQHDSLIPLLNSTITFLFSEVEARLGLGLGALKKQVYEVKKIPIINSSKFAKIHILKMENTFGVLSKRPIGTVFEELGANTPEDVSLEKVKPDRRELDKIIMGEILGLTEEEQLEVYKAVIDRVKSRIEKARSVSRKKKAKAPDPEKIAEGVLREIDTSNLKSFPDDYISGEYREIEVPEGSPEVGSDLKGFFVNVGEERIECESPEEAEYIKYAVISGFKKVKIPVDKRNLKKAIKEYKKAYKGVEKEIEHYLERFIPDRKLRERIEALVWKKLKGGERVGELKSP